MIGNSINMEWKYDVMRVDERFCRRADGGYAYTHFPSRVQIHPFLHDIQPFEHYVYIFVRSLVEWIKIFITTAHCSFVGVYDYGAANVQPT